MFRYFKTLKIHKYFLKQNCPQEYIKNYELKDISAILNSINLAPYEQDVIVFYGCKLHKPPYRGRYRLTWERAIDKIRNEFVKRGII